MEDKILKTLSGKRIALIGFGAEDIQLLSWGFDQVQAFARAVDPANSNVEPATVAAYDLLVLHVSEALAQNPWMQVEQLKGLRKPLLTVGSAAYVGEHAIEVQELAADFATLPVNPAEIMLRAYHVLSKAASAAHPADAPGPLKVVVADDDATTIALVKAVMQREGIECHIARDGGQALEMIQQVKPRAAVLDVNMPHMDGFEVLAAVRNAPSTAGTVVVLLTSRQQEADIVRAFGLGADDYIVKPFSPMELMARLRRLLRTTGNDKN